ncbi:MAG: putative Co/Zn/Cd efflux system rane fusion protein, partial [Edaphobacter sp.]|nr:putative Co/Zn/Cd efflux system rane fusion protein [Edaphobacter sp.]
MEAMNEQKSLETPDKKSTAIDPGGRGFNPEVVTAGVGFAILVAIATFWGIHTRSVTGKALAKETRAAAIPSVDVVHPSLGTKSYEVVLPASVQGFIDSPVYARTSGYLLHWYADIGTHVKKGQLLADIQTPELDQQVQQAQSDLATAQANYQLAQITADRWQKLLA